VTGRVLIVLYVSAVTYVCLTAVLPGLVDIVPHTFAWFGRPGSALTVIITMALPAVALLGNMGLLRRTPLLILTAMAASAVVLGMSSYWRCHGEQSLFFSPLAWTLGLFLGAVEDPFKALEGSACARQAFPVALEIARLLAIATTLTTALATVLTLFRDQLDKVLIRLSRSVTVVVGIDDESISMVEAISRTAGVRERLVILTADASRPAVSAAREAGAKIQEVNLHDGDALIGMGLWGRLKRLYMLSEDPIQNLQRFAAIESAVVRELPDRLRLPVTMRIDNPWEAEVWRRSFLSSSDQRWAADATGPNEITATRLVRHLLQARPQAMDLTPQTVLLCGLTPLTFALSSELAQCYREEQIYQRPSIRSLNTVFIMSMDAQSFVHDYQLRQQRIAPHAGALPIAAQNAEPTVDAIESFLAGCDVEGYTVIMTEISDGTDAIRLSSRMPGLRIYHASASPKTFTNISVINQLYSFAVNMSLDENTPFDAWERAAELIHENYADSTQRDTPATQHWEQLDSFFKQSNRRLVLNTLWMVEKFGGHNWNTLDDVAVQVLPNDFVSLEPLQQLGALGFETSAVEAMLRQEHEDWCRYYFENGWRFSERRDDCGKRHEKLLKWDELNRRDPVYRMNAMRSLVSTLVNLRILGYYSTPRRNTYTDCESV
jgi:hypothetical protein